jgi:hypothetical protein
MTCSLSGQPINLWNRKQVSTFTDTVITTLIERKQTVTKGMTSVSDRASMYQLTPNLS